MKPLLAYNKLTDLSQLSYPLYASPKLDGIRALCIGGQLVSRSLKPIPNLHIQETLKAIADTGLDGELMLNSGDFNSVQSAVMSRNGKPDFFYAVFDCVKEPYRQYYERLEQVKKLLQAGVPVHMLNQTEVHSPEEVQTLHDRWLAEGYEGSILRSKYATYKFGRSTLKEQALIKWVDWHRAEATVIGVEELMRNENDPELDNLGYQKRSHAQAGQVPGNTLGALVCKAPSGVTFKIGTGFDDKLRAELWANPPLDRLVTYKFKELSKYGVPRHPVFVGFRDSKDMS